MADNIEIVIKAKDSTKAGLSTVTKALDGLQSGWQKTFSPLEEIAKGVFRRIGEGITDLSRKIVTSLASGFADALKSAMSFEKGMRGLEAAFGASGAEAERLGKYIDELSLDPSLRVSADDAQQALELLGKAGIDVDQAIGGVARASVLLANATGEDIPLATEVAIKAMSAWGLQASDMEHVTNQITGATENSVLSLQDMFLAYSMGGGAAAAAGVSFEDFNATMASSITLFSSGSDAGTSFKTFLDRLIPSSKEAATKMQELGIITGMTEEQVAKFKDAQFDAIGKMDDANTTIAEQQLKLQKLAMQQAETGTAVQDGSLSSAEGALKMQDYSLQIEEANRKIREAKGVLEAGASAQSLLTEEVQAGTNAFFSADGQLKSTAEIAGILQNALSGLSEEQRKEALTTIFGSDAQRTAIALMNQGSEGVQHYQDIIGNTDAQARAAQMTDTVSDRFENFKETLLVTSRGIGERFLPAADDIISWAKETVDRQSPRVLAFFDRLGVKAQDLAGEFIKQWPKVEEFFSGLEQRLEDGEAAFRANWPAIKEWLANFTTGTVSAWKDYIQPALAATWDGFKALMDWFRSDDGQTVVGWAKSFVDIVREAFKIITRSVSLLIQTFSELGEAVKALGQGNWAGVYQRLNNANNLAQQLASLGSFDPTQIALQAGQIAAQVPSTATPDTVSDTAMRRDPASGMMLSWQGFKSWMGPYADLPMSQQWDIWSSWPGAALGGWHSGWTVVGENGPELVNLPGGSYVNNADKTESMGRGTTINIANLNLQGGANDGQGLAATVSFLSALYG